MDLTKNVLITGPPGIGKTTLIKKLSDGLKDSHHVGFYTAEIKKRDDVKLFEMTMSNRDYLSSEVLKELKRLLYLL